jgi:leucyl-tRNA synthetase
MPVGIGNEQAQLLAMSSPRVIELLDGKELLKVVVIPGKMINLVIKN